MKLRAALFSIALFALAAAAHADPPSLRTKGTTRQLIVNDKPFLMIGGELSNSAASSADYMAPHWAKLRAMHLNTVFAPVSWELIEPREGQFDWSTVDSMLKAARANDLKLVILWFGAWKNSMSTYVPPWVKRDQTRFPRAVLPNGSSVEILSSFSAEVLRADQKALAGLMRHLKAVDAKEQTVAMLQVENEIGMLPVARDYSAAATELFRQSVPKPLMDYLVAHKDSLVPEMKPLWIDHGARSEGNWDEVFGGGDAAAEVFTAWYYARFANELTAAAKHEYPLPMFVNVALNRPGRIPGEYPSGGPLPHLLDVWKAGAPNLDFIAPDIYFANFVEIAQHFRRPDNILFVPEAHNASNTVVPANAYFAFGALDAIGFGPFSIDSIDDKPGALADAYSVLEQLQPFILDAQGTNRIAAFKPKQLYDESLLYEPQEKIMGEFRLTVAFADLQRPVMTAETSSYGGMVIQIGSEEYLIAGQGITVYFQPVKTGLAGFESVWEGTFKNNQWKPGRLLNGDQTHQGRHIRLPAGAWQIQRVKVYAYH